MWSLSWKKATGLGATDLCEDVGVDGVAWHVCAMVAEDLGVDMDSHVLAVDLGTCIPGAAPPARALAYVVIWSKVLLPHLGTVMPRTLQVKCLENIRAPCQDSARALADTRQELVDVLGAPRKEALRLDRPVEDQERPSPLKRSRTPGAIMEPLAHKSAQVQFMIKNKVLTAISRGIALAAWRSQARHGMIPANP